MFLVKIMQYERQHTIGVFEQEANAIAFVESIPEITIERYHIDGVEEPFIDYSLDREALADYTEVLYKGKRVPLTKHMFVPQERISVFIIPIIFMDDNTQGLVDDATQVDAYIVANQEVEDYIQKREFLANAIMQEATSRGFRSVERAYAGSEDGEAIVAIDTSGNSRFLTHLDAALVDQFEFNNDALLHKIFEDTFN